jgi:hypothetical protein
MIRPGACLNHRQHSSRRGRGALLCSNRERRHGSVAQANQPPTNPARFTSHPKRNECTSALVLTLFTHTTECRPAFHADKGQKIRPGHSPAVNKSR